jgi:hypothetical protein
VVGVSLRLIRDRLLRTVRNRLVVLFLFALQHINLAEQGQLPEAEGFLITEAEALTRLTLTLNLTTPTTSATNVGRKATGAQPVPVRDRLCLWQTISLPLVQDMSDLPPYNISDLVVELQDQTISYKLLLETQASFVNCGFLPSSSIHSQSSVAFYSNVLQAPPAALNILKYGYKPG